MTLALDNLGAHLLGRTYVPDDRDWDVAPFLLLDQFAASGDALDAALKAVLSSHASAATKAFDSQVVAAIRALQGVTPAPPAPAPTPTPTPTPAPTSIEYANPSPNADQGQTPECTGYTGLNFLNTAPVTDGLPNGEGDTIYKAEKVIDGDNQDGSSTRSMAQVLQNMGRIKNYAWFSTTAQITQWLLAGKGTIPTGTDWYNDMFGVDDRNFVHATGGVAGGHEWLIVGVLPDLNAYVGCTPWGAFGANGDGRFLIDIDEYGSVLLAANGDAVAAVELP